MIEHTHPPHLDVKHAAQASLHLEGRETLSNYERLMAESKGLAAENPLHWTALTELRPDAAGESAAWLRLTVATTLPQTCQRCLEPVDIAVQFEREFRFVESEAVAEAQDDDCEEDLLVTNREFDLAALIEDEVLLALPLVPRHDTCPVNVKMVAVDEDFDAPVEKPNAFAVLAQLKAKD